MKIGILGAGHGGIAASADLTLMGHEVKLAAVEGHNKNIQLLKLLGNCMLKVLLQLVLVQ